MIANSRHKGGVCCKFLGQLSEQIPNRRTLATTLAVYSSICDISSKKNQTKRSYKIILCDFVNNKCSKGCEGSHISEDCDVHIIQCLIFQRRRGKVLYLGEGSCLAVSNSIVVTLQWIQILHCGHIDSSLETSDFSYIISMKSSICYVLEQARNTSIFHNRFIVMLRVGDPNHLHLCLIPCQSQMYLFMPRIMRDFYPRNTNQFLKRDELIAIGIEEIEDWLAICNINAVFWLHEVEVSDEIIDACGSIFVHIVGSLPKTFKTFEAYFCLSKHAQTKDYEGDQGCFHQFLLQINGNSVQLKSKMASVIYKLRINIKHQKS